MFATVSASVMAVAGTEFALKASISSPGERRKAVERSPDLQFLAVDQMADGALGRRCRRQASVTLEKSGRLPGTGRWRPRARLGSSWSSYPAIPNHAPA